MKLSDVRFLTGSALVVAAIAVAAAALLTDSLPVVGSGSGALLAVAVIGMAGCAVAGISQAPDLGWTSPATIIGAFLGVVALLVIGAGLLGWTGLLQPISGIVPVGTGLVVTTERIAVFALAAILAAKWLVTAAIAMARVPTTA